MNRLVFIAALSLAAGCESSSAAELWCEGYCDAVTGCRDHVQGCQSDCVARRPGLARFSQDAAELLKPCVAKLSCAALTDEAKWEAHHAACWEEAKREISPRENVRSFCTAFSERLFECGYLADATTCDQSYAMWSDAVVDSARDCLEQQGCDDLVACIEEVHAS